MRRGWRNGIFLCLAVTGLVLVIGAQRTFSPVDDGRAPTFALPSNGKNTAAMAARLNESNSPAVFVPLAGGNDALGARLRLIEAAESSIDIKTFLIKPDMAGALIWLELYEAAERGVRVRLLFDDVFTTARDDQIATLDAHPNVEIRAFNPLSRRIPYVANFLLDFSRVNRRMHNKAMIVDGSFAILGGRNIADEYYQIGTDHEFADFDLLMVGQATQSVSQAFDTFWNDYWSLPLADIAKGDSEPLRHALALFRQEASTNATKVYRKAVDSDFLQSLVDGEIPVHHGDASIVVDDIAKLRLPPGAGPTLVADAFYAALDDAKSDVVVMTPYFVPGEDGAKAIAALAKRGVRVQVVTNSLASNNHAYVHGGYAKYRRQLLAAGAEFYEVRADAPKVVLGLDTPLTMHTKLALIDAETIFAGSTNIDPRSFLQNTEISVIIDSKSLAENILDRVEAAKAAYTFSVKVGPQGEEVWYYNGHEGTQTFDAEPGAGFVARVVAWVAGWLPVEDQL